MRVIRHWWPNCRSYTAYSISLALHWYGFTVIVAWNKNTGVFSPIFRETAPNRGVTPADLYDWEVNRE